MADFGINEMFEMQRTLQERYKDKWEGFSGLHEAKDNLKMRCRPI